MYECYDKRILKCIVEVGMDNFEFMATSMKGPIIIKPFFQQDNRGSFLKDFEYNIYKKNGINFISSESFESMSAKNTIRGLHFQSNRPQAKLVRVMVGDIFDVIVDLRMDSETFGKWEGFYLSSKNHNILYVPRGFAHGFSVLSESALVSYKCDGDYDKESDTGIYYADNQLNIDWRVDPDPIVSQKDQNLMSFEQFKSQYRGMKL